ncbi:MAG: acyl-CoA thioesterase [Anaerolineae bacterium]|nr:acyl-CoA thioesterase [Anaerolineae bacterium]
MTLPAAEFPHCLTLDIIYRDIDALGHVNNAVYITHMETARIKFMSTVLNENSANVPLILAEIRCAYRSPAYYGEQLLIGTGVTRFGTKSFDFSQTIETTTGRLVAEGHSTMVWFNYERDATEKVPDWFREKVREFQAAWPEGG